MPCSCLGPTLVGPYVLETPLLATTGHQPVEFQSGSWQLNKLPHLQPAAQVEMAGQGHTKIWVGTGTESKNDPSGHTPPRQTPPSENVSSDGKWAPETAHPSNKVGQGKSFPSCYTIYYPRLCLLSTKPKILFGPLQKTFAGHSFRNKRSVSKYIYIYTAVTIKS